MAARLVETRLKKQRFLVAYAECGNVTHAAEIADIERKSHYRWLVADPEYATAFTEADERAVERLEQEARRRAAEGVEEPVYYQGVVCGHVRKYSDTLLIFLLKGARPEKYADRARLDIALKAEVHGRAEKLAAELDLPVEEVERDLVLGVEAARP